MVKSFYVLHAKEREGRGSFNRTKRLLIFLSRRYETLLFHLECLSLLGGLYIGRIQNIEKLNARGMNIHNGCSMCSNEEESVDH